MKRNTGILVSILLAMTLLFSAGCSVGTTKIRLKGVSLGTVAMDGKPVQGLPSQKIDCLLEVPAEEIIVTYSADGAILTLSPSGAMIEIKAGGISLNGIKSEQVKVEWAVSNQN